MLRSLPLLFLLLLSDLISAGPWVQKPSLPGPGRHRGFSFVTGNKAYVGGGWNGWTMWNDMWEYDPASNSWTQRANTPTNFYTSSGVGIGSKGYVTGGTLGAALYEYDPATNTWTAKASAPQAAFWESNAINLNNKLYMSDWNILMVYDPSVNSWQTLTPTPNQNIYGPGVSIGSFMYTVFEGGTGTVRFDPATNTYTQLASFPGESRTQASAFEAGGKIYAGCGDGVISDNIRDFWEYNPATNSWRQIDDLPGDTRENAVAFTLNGRGYLCTGTNGINHQDLWMLLPENITNVNDPDPVSISVFPNPSSGDVYFSLAALGGSETVIELYDATGQLARRERWEGEQGVLRRELLPAGMYSYTLFAGGKKYSGRIALH
ncbi:MAG: T9SS type A sorting domain-containing protein [Bacteroidia bacterium]|nr:T9SS type A sorting domain-containing protein [Bacteroidia bacterium]